MSEIPAIEAATRRKVWRVIKRIVCVVLALVTISVLGLLAVHFYMLIMPGVAQEECKACQDRDNWNSWSAIFYGENQFGIITLDEWAIMPLEVHTEWKPYVAIGGGQIPRKGSTLLSTYPDTKIAIPYQRMSWQSLRRFLCYDCARLIYSPFAADFVLIDFYDGTAIKVYVDFDDSFEYRNYHIDTARRGDKINISIHANDPT